MSSGFVGAKDIYVQNATQIESQDLTLRLHIFFESSYDDSAVQQIRRDNFQKRGINTVKDTPNWLYNEMINVNSQNVERSTIQKDESIIIRASIFERENDFGLSVQQAISNGKNIIMSYCINKEIKSLSVHIFIYCINLNDIVSHLFSTNVNCRYENQEKIDDINYKIIQRLNIRHQKIQYCKIDYIGMFDKKSDLDTLVSYDETENRAPFVQDVLDAIIMCQYTYNSQAPHEISMIAVINSIANRIGTFLGRLFGREESDESKEKRLSSKKESIDIEKRLQQSGWRVLDEKNLENYKIDIKLKSLTNGFYSRLFINENTPKARFAYCTCGTNMSSVQDWFSNNILQGLIGLSAQYTTSVQNALYLDKRLKGYDLIFIGHSLGGGLASNNAIVTTRHAITFNAAGLNPLRIAVTGTPSLLGQIWSLVNIKKLKANYSSKMEKAYKQVHAYIIKDEILNASLSHIMNEGAIGTVTTINIDSKFAKNKSKFGTSLEKHGLMNFLS